MKDPLMTQSVTNTQRFPDAQSVVQSKIDEKEQRIV